MTDIRAPRPRLSRCGLVDLLVRPSLRRSTAFLYYKDRDGIERPAGTVFAVGDQIPDSGRHWPYLVTARHVLEAARASTDADHVLIRVNTPESAIFVPVSFDAWRGHPEDNDGVGSDWLRKQAGLRVDVAAAIVNVAPLPSLIWDPEGRGLVTQQQVAEHMVSPGDDVAIIGLFRNHVGKQRNIPVVRSGMIAAMPEEPIDSLLGPMDAYLVEARSIGGLSGSPALWLSPNHRYDEDDNLIPVRKVMTRILGLVHGHFDAPDSDQIVTGKWPVPERLNEGMSIVVPARYIDEVIHQEDFMVGRRTAEEQMREEPDAAQMDSLVADDEDRESLAPLDPAEALKALLKTPPAKD